MSRLTFSQLKGILAVLRNFKTKENEVQKAWFIDIAKVFQEKSLRVFYMPLATIEKVLKSRSYHKLPDPRLYLIGVSQCESGLSVYEKHLQTVSPRKSLSKLAPSPQKRASPFRKTDQKQQLLKSLKFDSLGSQTESFGHKYNVVSTRNRDQSSQRSQRNESDEPSKLSGSRYRPTDAVSSKAHKRHFDRSQKIPCSVNSRSVDFQKRKSVFKQNEQRQVRSTVSERSWKSPGGSESRKTQKSSKSTSVA